MKLSDFDYQLPTELIAQHPLQQRDASRLLIVDRAASAIDQSTIANLNAHLHKGDTLVLNDTRVHPARLIAEKKGTGARIELLLLRDLGRDCWEAMAQRVSRLKVGTVLLIGENLEAEVTTILGDGHVEVAFSYQGDWEEVLSEYGHVPLPPYIQRDTQTDLADDRRRYQTVYARPVPEHPSAAAPTAGLHLTDELLMRLRAKGVRVVFLQLQVGRDTFLPVRSETLEEHRMHSEWFRLPDETASAINETRVNGGRVVAVGTTAVRVLESCTNAEGRTKAREGTTDLFIQPGYRFRGVDALLTNFHLPKSTLIVLVAAFCGRDLQRRAYQEAIRQRFRFYSYGDAMLIT